LGDLREKAHWEDFRCIWDYNIKMDIQEVGGGLDWVDLVQNMDSWTALVNAVRNFRVP
jgi:hypothetical protein